MHMQKQHPEKQTLTVVVNGTATEVIRNDNAPLQSVIGVALSQTNNTGQSEENWQLKDKAGNELDPHKKIGTFNFPSDVVLFLSLKAGIGG
jgi:hypothetical protein